MTIHWGSLLTVFLVSLGSTIAVVGLVTLAMLGLSARIAEPRAPFSPARGTVVAGVCLAAAALIVLFGLWTIVAK